MEREELLKALGRQEVMDNLRCLGCGYEHQCSTKGCAINRAAAELIKQLTVENEVLRHPFNPPLPLETLREMDGEPVWISSKGINRYDICCRVTTDNTVQFYKVALPGLEYGKTWLAYRRKPEEGTT